LVPGTTVDCWGANSYGQLGDGTTTDRPTPTAVPGASGVSAIAAGEVHTCALVSGTVDCWGLNGNGELGNGDAGSCVTARLVGGLSSGLGSGLHQVCVRATDGQGLSSSGTACAAFTVGSSVPDAPVIGSASSAGASSVSVGFAAPADGGGSAI